MYAGVPTTSPRGHRRREIVAAAARATDVGEVREPREPEVGDPHRAVALDQHVARLEVAVDEAGGVRGREPAPGLQEQATIASRVGLLRVEPVVERRAVDVLHDDVELAVVDADVVDRRPRSGGASRASAWASRRSRSCSAAPPPNGSRTSLIATVRPSSGSCAA